MAHGFHLHGQKDATWRPTGLGHAKNLDYVLTRLCGGLTFGEDLHLNWEAARASDHALLCWHLHGAIVWSPALSTRPLPNLWGWTCSDT